jgi:hypothetical protein
MERLETLWINTGNALQPRLHELLYRKLAGSTTPWPI